MEEDGITVQETIILLLENADGTDAGDRKVLRKSRLPSHPLPL